MIFFFNTLFTKDWLDITWLRIRAEANGLSNSAEWMFEYAVVQLSPNNTIAWRIVLSLRAATLQ
jgi:hypothetical protein